jgi:hypothetical protein
MDSFVRLNRSHYGNLSTTIDQIVWGYSAIAFTMCAVACSTTLLRMFTTSSTDSLWIESILVVYLAYQLFRFPFQVYSSKAAQLWFTVIDIASTFLLYHYYSATCSFCVAGYFVLLPMLAFLAILRCFYFNSFNALMLAYSDEEQEKDEREATCVCIKLC